MHNTCTWAAAHPTKVGLYGLPSPPGALHTALLSPVVQMMFPINYILAGLIDFHFLGMKFAFPCADAWGQEGGGLCRSCFLV